MQSHGRSRPAPHPTFDSYDLPPPTRSRASYRREDDLFDTVFPQPPPRSRIQTERLSRPSLPSLKAQAPLQVDSADSSQSTSQLLSSTNSIGSVNSLTSYPSSTSSLSLLHSIHPYKQASDHSSVDFCSPAISDVNSAETDHSVSSGHAHSQSSEIDAQEQGGPLTPLTPNGASQSWRPKELNLIRKRQGTGPTEPSFPAYQATPSWDANPTINADRNALLVGLGLGGIGFDTASSANVPAALPAERRRQSNQGRAFLRSKSPQLGPSAASTFSSGATQGPKQLLLVSSGGPPAVRRFPGRRPSEALHESTTSPLAHQASEQSSRCTTPQMRSTIPVMPSGPAFVATRTRSPDPSSTADERSSGPSAEEFLAQIASTPEYQASKYFGSSASSSAWPQDFEPVATGIAVPDNECDRPLYTALSTMAEDQNHERDTVGEHRTIDSVETASTATATTNLSILGAKGPGFSSTQRLRAASMSKRKAPPTPLVLTSSPATSNSDTLPGSAGGRRRRSLTAIINQRSPLSASRSNRFSTAVQPPGENATSAAISSETRIEDSASDYSEPLRTAFYDFDTEDGEKEDDTAPQPRMRSEDCPDVSAASLATTKSSASPESDSKSSSLAHGAAHQGAAIQLNESGDSRHSSWRSRVGSPNETDEAMRDSSGSEPVAAFEFADLETEASSEGLSLQTMMGFLQRQDSQKASIVSHKEDAHSPRNDSEQTPQPEIEAMYKRKEALIEYLEAVDAPAAPFTALTEEPAEITPPSSAAPDVPSFNISIFAPSQATETKVPPQLRISVDPKDSRRDGEVPTLPSSPGGGLHRARKQSVVPPPPVFAIRDAARDEQSDLANTVLASPSGGLESGPVIVRADSNEGATGNSRWSSGSESDGESEMPTKAGGRKSFSKGRKSFSTSRKNSVAIARELIAGPIVAKEAALEVGRRQSKRSSKTRLSSQGVSSQTLPTAAKPSTASVSKRLFLNGLPSLRKKSFPNLSGQSASPLTPSSAHGPTSAGPAFTNTTEYPFPTSPQLMRSLPVPSITTHPLECDETAGLMAPSASAASSVLTARLPSSSPRTPMSISPAALSVKPSGPLTTQQILAQARNNVWPENFIGTSVSAAGMSSPYLSASQDAFNFNFTPSRLAPTPPSSASGTSSRLGWSSAPHTPPMPHSPRFGPNAASEDKPLPVTQAGAAIWMDRSRSRTAEISAPPKNLRHMRQTSSNTNLDTKDVVADAFRPTHTIPYLQHGTGNSFLQPAGLEAMEEKLSPIVESSRITVSTETETQARCEDAGSSASFPVLVSRGHAKLQKARRIRKQQDRFPHHNSWSEIGMQWVAEQGADAFEKLAAESLPSSAILTAAMASAGGSDRMLVGGSGGGADDDDSDESDTDDYGSSDGGGGAGGFGGAGGGGGGKHPGQGRDDAHNLGDDEEEEETDEEEAQAMTDEDSDDNYGEVEKATITRSAGGVTMPVVPTRNASIPASNAEDGNDAHSDSSDDRPLGLLVNDPKALQKTLRAQERKRHFALAAQALEGRSSSGVTLSTGSRARHTGQASSQAHPNDAVVNPNDLAQRLAKVQGRRERANAPNTAALMQRSQTVARQDVSRTAEKSQHADPGGVSRSKSVRATPAERYMHPGLRARTPSEAALRAKAIAQATSHGASPVSPTLPTTAKMPSNAMATVVAAQKAMAHAQANPTPAALAQAQALATSATAALNAATAQVKRNGSSPISPSFNQGEPVGHPSSTSPRMAEVVELPGARHRTNSRGQALPAGISGAVSNAAPAVATAHHPDMMQRLRSRSVSRNQTPLTINTAAAPPMPDMPRPSTASKDSQASSSPHSVHAPTFVALSQAAMHHGRPSVDSNAGRSDTHAAQMHRGPSNAPTTLSSSHDSGVTLGVARAEPRQSHKVFILSRQRFTVVEVPVSARARDLALEVIERESLPMDDSKGGWVVFDCSSHLSIERPLREYEIITDVVNVRAHPKTDFFLIKRTELSPYLSLRSVPVSSPALAGYVYVQDRKKKWNKRWLELRDHSLYHAKNEKGKDEMPICQISTFDIYLVDGSAFKMPKANGFALRSQDPITMFEKPDQDYIHYFCLTDPAAHRDWVRAILNARTYMLRQEKAVLFQMDSPANTQEASATGTAASNGGLSRKSTSRRPNGRTAAATEMGKSSGGGPSPPTPLVDSNAFAGPFAKGSLLADKAINDAKEALRGHVAAPPPSAAFNDLSLMDRNAVRLNEARRRDEAIERQRRLKADGQPLIDLTRK